MSSASSLTVRLKYSSNTTRVRDPSMPATRAIITTNVVETPTAVPGRAVSTTWRSPAGAVLVLPATRASWRLTSFAMAWLRSGSPSRTRMMRMRVAPSAVGRMALSRSPAEYGRPSAVMVGSRTS